MNSPIYNVAIEEIEGRSRLIFSGQLRFRETYESWDDVQELLDRTASSYDIDLSGVESIDGGSAALLIQLKNEILERDPTAQILGAQGAVESLLQLYGEHAVEPSHKEAPKRIKLVDQLGDATAVIGREVQEAFDYVGEFIIEGLRAIRRPRSVHWPEMWRVLERSGPDALPIVMLINFLVGLILAFQAADQLRQYGADIFVADLVGLSIVRELGPLMSAIIVAGRSGAAFAAEIGTMRVSEEVDAVRTLGLSPVRFLVFPRFIAMLFVLPALTLLGNGVAICGGMLVAVRKLDMTVVAYLTETARALQVGDVASGLFKSFVFAAIIALVGCQKGLATRGGAAGVGNTTTSAVVTMIFFLIFTDAIFTVVFNVFGI